jgi:hypothetical protein
MWQIFKERHNRQPLHVLQTPFTLGYIQRMLERRFYSEGG